MLQYNGIKKVIQPNKTLTDFFLMLNLQDNPTDYKWYSDNVEINPNFKAPIFTQVQPKSNITLQKIINQQTTSQPSPNIQQSQNQNQNQEQEQASSIKKNLILNPFIKQQQEQQKEQESTQSQKTYKQIPNPFLQSQNQQQNQELSKPIANFQTNKSPEINRQPEIQQESNLQDSQICLKQNSESPKPNIQFKTVIKPIELRQPNQILERLQQPTQGQETSGWKTVGKYECNIVKFGNEIQLKTTDGTLNVILKEEMFTPESSQQLKFHQSEFSIIDEHKITCNGTKVIFFKGLIGLAVKWATGMQCRLQISLDQF